MNRAYLGTYLTGQYAALVATAKVSETDDAAGYGPALDNVLRLLGLATQSADPNPTIPPEQESDALLLTRYYALDWLLQALSVQVDTATQDQRSAKSQRFKQVQQLLAQARDNVPSQYALEPGDFAVGRLQLDILEPTYTAIPPYGYWW